MPLVPLPKAKGKALTRFNRDFVAALEQGVSKDILGIRDETTLKQRFIEKQAKTIRRAYPELQLFTPPWGSEKLCATHLKKAGKKGPPVEIGCRECWKESKDWASVDAWGMRHNFDLVVRDSASAEALVLEVKMFDSADSPNAEIQRFLGQLLLARSKHPIVAGVCGRIAGANTGLFKDTETVRHWCQGFGLELVFVDVP